MQLTFDFIKLFGAVLLGIYFIYKVLNGILRNEIKKIEEKRIKEIRLIQIKHRIL